MEPAGARPSGAAEAVDEAFEETPEQRYVGARDLTRWPSAAGQFAVRLWTAAGRWLGPHQLLAGTLLAGLIVVGLLAAAAAQVYDAVTESEGVALLDQPVLDAAIGLRTPTLNDVAGAYTHLGDTPILPIAATVIVVGLALWWRQWSPIMLTTVTALGALALTVVGKAEIGRVRPPMREALPPFETSFSFPSGHSLNSMAIAGIIAYLLIRKQHHRWARITTIAVALTYALTIGLSRVYLGAHWMTDVLVAWALALAWLAVVITAHRLFLTFRRPLRTRPG